MTPCACLTPGGKLFVKMPFNGFEDFEACTTAMTKKGHDEESAKKICGRLQADAGESGGKKDSRLDGPGNPFAPKDMRTSPDYKAYQASRDAEDRSAAVNQHTSGSLEHNIAHETAANAHRDAATAQEKNGNAKAAEGHRAQAAVHTEASKSLRVAAQAAGKANQASAKAEMGTGTHAAAAAAHEKASSAMSKAGNHELAGQHAGKASEHAAKAAGGGDDYNRDEQGKFASK